MELREWTLHWRAVCYEQGRGNRLPSMHLDGGISSTSVVTPNLDARLPAPVPSEAAPLLLSHKKKKS